MVNNSTNFNKKNNHLSPQISEHKKKDYNNEHMTLEIQVLAWDMHKNVATLHRLIGSLPSSSW
jgi:hypothetical protein